MNYEQFLQISKQTKSYDLDQWVNKLRPEIRSKYTYTAIERVGPTPFITYTCPEHGEIRQAFRTHYLSKYGCPKCANAVAVQKATKTNTRISVSDWEKRGRELLGDSFIGVDQSSKPPKFIYNCDKHGVQRSIVYNMLNGHRCPRCGVETRSAQKLMKVTDETFTKLNEIHRSKYTYLGTEVSDNRTYIRYTCGAHGETRQSITQHLVGHGCAKCGTENVKRSLTTQLSDFIEQATKLHADRYLYIGLSFKEIGGRTIKYVTYLCPTHGLCNQRTGMHLNGTGCPACALENLGTNKRRSLESYKADAQETHGTLYEYLEVIHAKFSPTFLKIKCSQHGEFIQNARDHINGSGCPKCVGRISKGSIELASLIETFGLEVKSEVRLAGSSMFWDIVVPAKKIAIEFHGLYWHSSKHHDKDYHLHKHQEGLQAGYRTIHIFEDEWKYRRQQVERVLASALGVYSTEAAVYARKSSVRPVLAKEARPFLDVNHVQGFKSSSTYIGLEYQGELVAVLGYEFRESGRGKTTSKESMEITRYATSQRVVGGMSKLLKSIACATPELRDIYSFSDIRMYTGQMYEACGFSRAYDTTPDYQYVIGDKRTHKSGYQKSRFQHDPKLLYQEGLTELQLAELNEIYRIYDCGKTKWVKTIR